MNQIKRRILCLLLGAVMVLGALAALRGAVLAEGKTLVEEIRVTSSIKGVSPGELPTTIDVSTDTEHVIIMNAYPNEAHWVYRERFDKPWKNFPEGTTPTAEEGEKHYGIEFAIFTNPTYAYEITKDTKIWFNGKDVSSDPATEIMPWSWGAWVTVDLGLCGSELPQDYHAFYVVTAGSLNVREKGDSLYNKIGGLKFGDIVEATAISGEWVKIQFDGREGWVNKNFLALTYSKESSISPTEHTVTANALNVRADISTTSERIGGLKSGDKILATGKRTDGEGKDWFVLDYSGDGEHKLGYVLAEFTDGKEAKQEKFLTTVAIPVFPFIGGGMEPHAAAPVIARADKIIITEENVAVLGDGDYTLTVFPDDGDNFRDLIKDQVVLPAGSLYFIKALVANEDGSITISIGKEKTNTNTNTNTNTIDFDANGQSAASGEISYFFELRDKQYRGW